MKKALFFLTLTVLSVCSYSQNQKASITWGTSHKSEVYSGSQYILGKKGDYTYVFEKSRLINKENAFYVLDKNMEIIKTHLFKFKGDIGNDHSIKNATLINDEIVIYYSTTNYDNKSYCLVEKRFDIKNFLESEKDKLVFETPYGKNEGRFYRFKKLSDSTKTVIFGGSTTSNVLGVMVYDNTTGKTFLNRTVQLNLDGSINTIGNIEVDKNATVYIGARTMYETPDIKNNNGRASTFQIHSFEKNSTTDKKISLDKDRNILFDVVLSISDNKLCCLGVFCDQDNRNYFKGYSVSMIDINTKKIENEKFNVFNSEVLLKMKKTNFIFTGVEFTIMKLIASNVIIHADGSLSFIIEQITEQSIYNIILIKVDKNGNELWTNYIERNIYNNYFIPLYQGLFLTSINDDLIFPVYQNKNFADSKITPITGLPNKSILVIYKIDKDGNKSYTEQNEYETNNRVLIIGEYYKISNSEFIVVGLDDKDLYSYGTLKIKP